MQEKSIFQRYITRKRLHKRMALRHSMLVIVNCKRNFRTRSQFNWLLIVVLLPSREKFKLSTKSAAWKKKQSSRRKLVNEKKFFVKIDRMIAGKYFQLLQSANKLLFRHCPRKVSVNTNLLLFLNISGCLWKHVMPNIFVLYRFLLIASWFIYAKFQRPVK